MQKLAEYDIVVTTYETLSSDMQGRSKKVKTGDANPVPRIHWHRVVLDESHAIKDQSTKSFKAIDAIQSTCRWACTGTPVNTVRPLPMQCRVLLTRVFCHMPLFVVGLSHAQCRS